MSAGWERFFFLIAQVSLILSVFSAPLMIGSVPLWSVGVGLGLSCIAFSALSLSALIGGSDLRFHPVSWAFAAILVYEAIVLVPLPPILLSFINPKAVEIYEYTLESLSLWPAWRPLSLDPIAGGLALVRHTSWFLLFLCATNLSIRRKDRDRIILALGLSLALMVTLAFGQKLFGFDRIFGVYPTPPGGWIFASFINPNHFGAYLNLLAPVCLALSCTARDRSKSTLWAILFVFAGVACLLTLSRGAIVALVVSLSVFAFLRRRKSSSSKRIPRSVLAPIVLVGGIVSIGAYLALDPILSEVYTLLDQDRLADEVRWKIWAGALALIGDYWAVGIGRGSFEVVYPMYKQIPGFVTFSHAENQSIQAFAELGVVFGLLLQISLLMGWLLLACRRGLSFVNIGLLCGLAGLAIHELTDFSTSFGGVAVPASVVFALAMGADIRYRRMTLHAKPIVSLVLCIGISLASASMLVRATDSMPDDVLTRMEAGTPIHDIVFESIRDRPSDYVVPLFAAQAYLGQGNLNMAMYWAARSIYLSPSDSRGHLVAAGILARARRLEQALLQYRLAAKWGESPSRILQQVADICSETECLVSALPDSVEAKIEVVRYLFSVSRLEDALEFGLEVLGEDPTNLEIMSLSARSSLRLGDAPVAAKLSGGIVLNYPSRSTGYILLADALAAQSEYAQAASVLEDGLTRIIGDEALSMKLARILIKRKNDAQGALDVLERMNIPLNNRGRADMHLLRADAHNSLGRTRRAMEEYRSASRFRPNDPRPWISMGDYFMSTRQWESALEAYLEAGSRRESAAVDARIKRASERVDALKEFRQKERYLGEQ